MAVRPVDVRAIVERVCARPEVLDACARGDLGTVIDALWAGGLTQGRISGLTGIPQGRLSEWKTGKREPKGISTFQKFADGVGMPPAARRALGLDSEAPPAAPASPPDLSMPYPDTPADATRNASQLWLADLSDATALQRGRADLRAWNDASLRRLVDPGRAPGEPARGVGDFLEPREPVILEGGHHGPAAPVRMVSAVLQLSRDRLGRVIGLARICRSITRQAIRRG